MGVQYLCNSCDGTKYSFYTKGCTQCITIYSITNESSCISLNNSKIHTSYNNSIVPKKSWRARRALAAIFGALAAAGLADVKQNQNRALIPNSETHAIWYVTKQHTAASIPKHVQTPRSDISLYLACNAAAAVATAFPCCCCPRSPCFGVSSGYKVQVQSIMKERHWAYLALFLAESADLCGSVCLRL